MRKKRLLKARECYLCAASEDLQVHHIDWHRENNDPTNLVTVCQYCHSRLHKEGYVSREELLLRHGHMELLHPDLFLPRLLGDLDELSDLPHRLVE
jgi:uncharacterized protein YlaI